MGASPVGWVLLRSGRRCYSGCGSQAHCHFLEQSVSTQNSSVMDHAALCCTSNLPEVFSRTPAHPVSCYSRRCGAIHEVLPLHLVILLLPGHIPHGSSPSPQAPGRAGAELGPAELGAAVVRLGHVENSAPHLVSLTHSWPGSLGALVVLICCFCLIPDLGGILLIWCLEQRVLQALVP